MKKLFVISLLFIGIISVSLSSCTKNDEYWEIQSFSFSFYDDNLHQYYGDTIVSNNLAVDVNFVAQYSAVLRRSLPFINEAYAASEPNHPGLKHSISHLYVTTISDFNGIKAGDDISTKLSYCGQVLDTYCANQSLQNFIYNEMKQEMPFFEHAYFKFKEKPIVAKQQLKFRFVDSQGKEFVGVSNVFYWK